MDEYDNDDGVFLIESVDSAWNQTELKVVLDVHDRLVEFKIDTGAKYNIDTLGTVTFPYKGAVGTGTLKVHVVNQDIQSLLGLSDCVKMQLVKISSDVHEISLLPSEMDDILVEYQNLVDGTIGKLPAEYKIRVDPSITPVINPPRKAPVAMADKVKAELDRMVRIGVITEVSEPTGWVNSMVAARKKGKDEIRICLDPRPLNMAVRRPHYPMRTVEEVLTRIAPAKYFTVLEAKSSFWQIPLEERSSYYTTFNSPFGRYHFLRVPFGISSGPEVCQQTTEHLFGGYPCEIIMDDILVWGADDREHDTNLRKILDRAREINPGLHI